MINDFRTILERRPAHRSRLRKLIGSEMTRKIAAVLFGLSDVLLILFILLPFPFGGQWIMVLSGSMTPALEVGGMVMMMPVEPATLRVGDVIAHNPPGYSDVIVAHRVIEVIEGDPVSFRTKGDANEEEDQYTTPADNVVGKIYFHIPRLGYILDEVGEFGGTPLGMALLMGVPGVLVVLGEVRNIASARNPRKRREKVLRERMKKRMKSLKRKAI